MKRKDFNIFSLLWTLLLHAAVVGLLLLLHLNKPVVQAESGVPVMLGNLGNLDTDYEFTEVNSMPAPAPASVPVPVAPQAEPVITQNLEETVAIESGEKEKAVTPTETVKQPTPEELRAEQERKAAEVDNLMASAFGRSSSMQASTPVETNTEVQGTLGSERGNSNQGKTSGTGAWGQFDLEGRDVVDGLVRPAYGVQEEGRVVVTITVDPEGKVIDVRINNRTNTTNLQLKNAALEAARRTRFNAIGGENNQTGTIIYYFKLN
ncbi:MAG: TonB family protein [Bacteroidaceae bacterium]|nr:TonB family protein [Bacteroidaceae bacterium]